MTRRSVSFKAPRKVSLVFLVKQRIIIKGVTGSVFDPLSLASGSAAPRRGAEKVGSKLKVKCESLSRNLQLPVIVHKGARAFQRIQLSAIGAIRNKPSPLGKVAQRLLAGSETDEVGELSERKL